MRNLLASTTEANYSVKRLLCLLIFLALVVGCSGKQQASRQAAFDPNHLFPIWVNDKCGYINRAGKIIIQPIYNATPGADEFHEGLVPIMIGNKWGYLDLTGKIEIKPQFDEADGFSDGLASVVIHGKSGYYIDKKGKIVIEPRFAGGGSSFSEGLAMVVIGKGSDALYGYMDKTGKMVIKPQYYRASDFSEGLAWVDNGEPSYIDRTGRIVITQFNQGFLVCVGDFHSGLARFGSYPSIPVYIDKTGKVVIPKTKYCETNDFSEGLAAVGVPVFKWVWWGKTVKYGYINTRGETVIKPHFDRAGSFSEGLAPVEIGDSWGYIDRAGKMVIKPRFSEAEPFHEGLARVNHDYSYVDRTGKFVWKPPDTDTGSL